MTDARPGGRARRLRPVWRRVRGHFVAGAAHATSLLLLPLPWRTVQALGRRVGRLGWRLGGTEAARTVRHLAIAFPDEGPAELEALGRRCWEHLGTTLGEFLYLLRRGCPAVHRHVRLVDEGGIAAWRDTGLPLVIVTGHCGNWELLAAAISCHGAPPTVVARAIDAAALDDLVVGFRARFGTTTSGRGEAGAARHLLRALREGRVLGLLIDQDTNVDGVWVPFFGRPAYTPVAAAQLALRRRTLAATTFIERLADGSHVVWVGPPLELPPDPTEATAQLTAAIEAQIRRVPEQWVWMHRRWRRQPPPA